MEELRAIAARLEKSVEENNAVTAKTRLEVDAITEMYSEQLSDMRKHYGRIIMGLILTLIIILGSIVGGAVYLFANFDMAVVSTQDVISDNNSNATIYDGINLDMTK